MSRLRTLLFWGVSLLPLSSAMAQLAAPSAGRTVDRNHAFRRVLGFAGNYWLGPAGREGVVSSAFSSGGSFLKTRDELLILDSQDHVIHREAAPAGTACFGFDRLGAPGLVYYASDKTLFRYQNAQLVPMPLATGPLYGEVLAVTQPDEDHATFLLREINGLSSEQIRLSDGMVTRIQSIPGAHPPALVEPDGTVIYSRGRALLVQSPDGHLTRTEMSLKPGALSFMGNGWVQVNEKYGPRRFTWNPSAPRELAQLPDSEDAGQLSLSVLKASGTAPVGSSFDLGSVALGNTLSLTLQITNTSSSPAIVQTISIDGASFSLPGTYIFELPYVLAPSASWNFKIGFTPTALGQAQGTLHITPGITVALTGTGVPPAGNGSYAPTLQNENGVLAPGSSISFGRVEMGSSTVQSFIISNTNPGPITISSVVATGPGFVASGVVTPQDIPAGGAIPFQVTFTPAAPNAAQGTLTINQASFTLTGSGYAQPFPATSLEFSSSTAQSAQQPTVSVKLASPATADATGLLKLSFQSSVPGSAGDTAIGFLSGNPTAAQVVIHKGDTSATIGGQANAAFQTGTTAGAIQFHLSLANGTMADAPLTIAPQTVQLNSTTAVAETGQLIVSLTGYDNTHAASQLSFTFYDSNGKTVSPGTITTDASSVFASYFSGNNSGGAFALRAAFPVTGSSVTIASVTVEIKNPAGNTQTTQIPFR